MLALVPGNSAQVCAHVNPLCRGQWFSHHKSALKKRGWVPWFCRENLLLDLWQVPHSVEAWGPKSQIWLYKMATQPPQVIFWGYQNTSQYYFALQSLHKVLPRTKLAQSTSQDYFILQSLHKVLPSTTSYYKACAKCFPVLLGTTKLAKYFPGQLRTTKLVSLPSDYFVLTNTSQYYFVLQSLHKALPSTSSYYKACTKYFPVLLRTAKLAQSTLRTTKLASQHYFVLQSLHKVLPSTTSYCRACTVLPRTTSYYKACTEET